MVRSDPRIALACCTLLDGTLAVLATRRPLAATDGGVALPRTDAPGRKPLDASAERLASELLGESPPWMTQVGAFSEASALEVLYVAVVPSGTSAPAGHDWIPVSQVRATTRVTRAVAALRERLDREPIAFHLLPPRFTLSDLQQVYALLLERKLHKASFRRTLMAAHVVEPTDEWRSEGRGRPAQLFRYAARRRRGIPHRAVRFEFRD